MNEKVSVIIPTYKGSDKIRRAIECLINQTYKNIEIIIVDDNDFASEEQIKTKEIVCSIEDERVKYIEHRLNKNGAVARNTGIKNSTGIYITFLDDDDFLFMNRIEVSVNSLRKNPQYDAVACNVIIIDNNNLISSIEIPKEISQAKILLNDMVIGTGSNIFFRKEVLRDVDSFDESFKRHQDLEFLVRLTENKNILGIRQNLIIKATNQTNNSLEYEKLKEIKEKYRLKYTKQIEKLSEIERKKFHKNEAEILFKVALNSTKKEEIEATEKILKLGGQKEVYVAIICRKIGVYNLIKKYGKKIRDRRARRNLSEVELKYIQAKHSENIKN